MKAIGIIPARYASTRFPGKPLANINGITMIEMVYLKASKALSEVYVATDDKRIFAEVRKFNGNVVMTSCEHKSGTDRIAEAVQIITKQTNTTYDIVINIQGDEPFIQTEQIIALKNCFDSPDIQIATLIKQIETSEDIFDPNKVKVIADNNNIAKYFSRSPIPYIRGLEKDLWINKKIHYKHIGMYAYTYKTLLEISKLEQSELEKSENLEQLRWLENSYIIKIEKTSHESIGIDTPEDLVRVKKMGLI